MPLEIGVYLLTPTHVGAGATAGAIDLPIARESHTNHPLLPSSALKGVARRLLDPDATAKPGSEAARIFGPPPPRKGVAGEALTAGEAVFTDGILLAFPVRSLHRTFVWVTSRHTIERWRRSRRLLGMTVPTSVPGEGAVATFAHTGQLVLDAFATPLPATADTHLVAIAKAWKALLPDDGLARQLPERLVCLSDGDFSHLVQRCTPVAARVQLTPGKTTDAYRWTGDDGTEMESKGNLWYEESLPAECLFAFGVHNRGGGNLSALETALGTKGKNLQVGGNETVGMGMTAWTLVKS
jgi:CRISPR-associated protein Cmr4